MEKRTKVLFLITKSNFGGAQRYVFDLASHLPRERFEVTVAAGGSGILHEKLRAAGVRTVEIPDLDRDVRPLADLRSFGKIRHLIRTESPDVLHLNSSKIGGLGALAGRLSRVPRIIFTAHGLAFAEDRSSLSKFLIRAVYWITCLLAHKTIAVSDSIRHDLSRMGAGRITTIHHGIEERDTLSHEDARRFFRGKNPALNNEFWIGTIAELHPIKGLTYAIDAIGMLRGRGAAANFIVLGEGDARSVLEKQIAENNLADSVYLAGFVPDAAQYVRAFDIFTMTSIHEGLNFALLEAGSAGVPVVATNVGGIPEIVADAGLLVPARDARATADALEKLANDPKQRETLGRALQERVRSQFSFDEMLRKTTALYAD